MIRSWEYMYMIRCLECDQVWEKYDQVLGISDQSQEYVIMSREYMTRFRNNMIQSEEYNIMVILSSLGNI